jgi:hypothetical protein
MKPASLPYPGYQDLSSGELEQGGYRIAYHDIAHNYVHYINNITISKGHRLVSGFFGFGLMIAGLLDRSLKWAPTEDPTVTSVFGLLTSLILIFICYSRNVTIHQLMGILQRQVEEEGFGCFTKNEELKGILDELDRTKYYLSIPSPFLMLKGIEVLPLPPASNGSS